MGRTLRRRQIALRRSSTPFSRRSGSAGGATGAGRTSWRAARRPRSPRRAPNRSSQSPSSAIGMAPAGNWAPNPSRASSGHPIALRTWSGANTSSPSGSTGSMIAPSLSSRSATKSRNAPMASPSRRLEILPEQLVVECLGPLMLPACGLEPLAKRAEGLGAGVVGRLQPRFQHQVRELAFLLKAAENGTNLAHDQLEHRDLFLQQG